MAVIVARIFAVMAISCICGGGIYAANDFLSAPYSWILSGFFLSLAGLFGLIVMVDPND